MTWMDRYMEYTKNFESPDSFHRWCGMWAIGSMLGRKVWTRVGSQIHYPNMYTILVSPSAVARKSTAMEIAIKLMDKAGKVNFMRDKITDAALWKRLAKLSIESGRSTLSVHIDELSTCFSADNSWSKDLISSLTRLYVGADYITKELSAEGTLEVFNVCVSLLAGTTPSDLMTIFPRVTTGMGFSGRCMFIFEQKRRFKNPIPTLLMEHEQPLVMGLREFSMINGEIPLTPAALEFYNKWYNEQPEIYADDISSSFIARKHIHMVHAALILTVAKRENEITRETLSDALREVEKIQKNLKHTLERVGLDPVLADVETLKEILKRTGKASISQILKSRKLNRYRLQEALAHLEEQDMVTYDYRAPTGAGRPAKYIILKKQEEE